MKPTRSLWLLLAVCGTTSISGCLGVRKARSYDAPTVQSIHFDEGQAGTRWLRGTSDYNLRTAIRQEDSPLGAHSFRYGERVELDLDTLKEDAWRLELWYAHHGFFDARVLGWEIQTTRPARSRLFRSSLGPYPPVVRIRGFVREGPESLVRTVRFEGLDSVPALRSSIRRRAVVQVGERFQLDGHRDTVRISENILRDASFARARIEGEIHAYPEDRAVDLVYRVEGVGPGEACRFGEVTVIGGRRVPETLVRQEIAITRGEAFSTEALAETQLRVFGLGAFSLVQVTPDITVTGEEIPVEIRLSEASFRELKVGTGLGFQNGEQQVRASSQFSHSNLFQRLVNLEIGASAGYKFFGAGGGWGQIGSSEDAGGPFVDSHFAMVVPGVLGPGWSFRQGGEVELDVEPGNRFFRWEIAPSLSYRIRPGVTTTTAYHLERWTGDLDGLLTDAAVLGIQADEYLLSTLEQRLLLDGRNDRLNTRQGNYAELSVAVAGLGFGYHFWKSEADLRAYLDTRRFRSLLGPMVGVLATRLAGGVAMPHSLGLEEGEEAGAFVPYAERLFLGGSSSVRGWVPDHLGPQVCSAELCLPEGAQIAAWGSVEYRLDGPVGASLVGFLDLGMAWRDLEAFELSSLQPSAGLGLRYGTPVGPIRIDLAFRLRDDADFAHEPGFNVHAGLSEAF